MPFKTIRQLFYPRASWSGKPERLTIELVEGPKPGLRFVSLKLFWMNAEGKFCPPRRDAPCITIRRSEAEEVIELLREVLTRPDVGPARPD